MMVSFDVVSLFTNVSVSLATNIVRKRWPELFKIWTGVEEDLFFRTLEFCFSSSFLQFEGKTYSQVEGLAMGSLLSPVIADLVLDELFDLVERRFGTDILFMTKYVDDSLFFIHKRIHGPLLNYLNGFHNRIKFEYENECNNTVNFA